MSMTGHDRASEARQDIEPVELAATGEDERLAIDAVDIDAVIGAVCPLISSYRTWTP